MNEIRFCFAALLLCLGSMTMLVALLGVFRFRFVMNRLHCAAVGDTLGIGMIVAGLLFTAGSMDYIPKLLALLGLLWLGNPVASRLLARLELTTDKNAPNHMDREDRT
ncbi:MAG: monovalent cation/H(+) antiporter subunit G [Oscillospiraceae bacterium]|nr:monovalent cation/H(+) antiporter subunit G [Oscillospiraceae bacterium]